MHEKLEDTAKTIKELEKEQKKKKRGDKPHLALRIIFAPYFLLKKVLNKLPLPLIPKIVILLSLVLAIILAVFSSIVLISVANAVGQYNPEFVRWLVITVSITVSVSFVAFVGIIVLICVITLGQIKKIARNIDKITADDLSKRIEVAQSSDELKSLTIRINQMLDGIEEVFERQENFVADASHELKTPLSVISGYSNLLKRWGTENKAIVLEAMDTIKRECENMQHIVAQLLLLAKIGSFNKFESEFDINALCSDIIEGYKVLGISQLVSFEGLKNAYIVNTDKNLITTLLRIFIDNAIRYTHDGGSIIVRLEVDDFFGFSFSVTDNGIGIAPEEVSRIFERFYRVDKARSRGVGGTGLGLTIAKQIAEILGGTILVKSVLASGSTFVYKNFQLEGEGEDEVG